MGRLVQIAVGDVHEPVKLVDHRRDNEKKDGRDDCSNKSERDDDAQDSARNMKFVLHELHDRIK